MACHHTHDTGVEGELEDDAACTLCSCADCSYIVDRSAVEQNTDQQEDQVNDVQGKGIQNAAGADEILNQIDYTDNYDEQGKNSGVLQFLSNGSSLHVSNFVIDQKLGIDGNGVFRSRMHLGINQRHEDQDNQANDQIPGSKNSLCKRDILGNNTCCLRGNGLIYRCDLKGNGTRQTCMPENESGVSGCNQKTIVNALHLSCNLFCKKSTNYETEAPVEPAGDGGNKCYQDDAAGRRFSSACDAGKKLLDSGSVCHCGTQNKYQCHLHGECKQAPYIITPEGNNLKRSCMCCRHGKDEYDDGKDDTEDKCIRQ